MDQADVPCAPVLRRNEIIEHEQVKAMGLIETMEQPFVGTVRQPRAFADFEATPPVACGPAPTIGEHTQEILRELGLQAKELEDLIGSGAAVVAKSRVPASA